jgi:hypothetical protein
MTKRNNQQIFVKLCSGYYMYMLHVCLLVGFGTNKHLIMTC